MTQGEPPAPPLPWRVRRPRSVGAFLSPAVLRTARARGIDPAALRAAGGSGAQGRVTLADLARRADAGVVAGVVAGVGAGAGAGDRVDAGVDVVASAHAGGDERVPFTRVQTRAGPALLASTRMAAHALTIVEADYSAVEVARREWRERFRAEEGFSLTYLPFVARAVVDALRAFPLFNATMGDDSLLVRPRVGLGIAVDLDHQGLVVPVVHAADSLRLRALARAIDDLARRARAKRLKPDDAVGGTFTITNPGGYGTEISVPIINQPEVGILSTDGVRKRVVVASGGDALVIRPTGYLCLSFDHRAIDGAYAGAFVGRVREILEGRDWLTEM